ncbi:MAG: hypothetical protein GXP45_02580 [bacterium]|nr:hypothetical protein [bacterium]
MPEKKTHKASHKKITKTSPKSTPTKTPHTENKVEELEKKIGELEKKFGLLNKFLKQKWMKDFLNSKAINDINKTFKPNLKTIFTVVGVLAFISAIMSFFGFFGVLGLGAFGISRGFILIMAILLLVSTVISLLTGIGLFKSKKRLPFVILLSFFFQILMLIVSSLSRGYRAGNLWISFIVITALLILVLKNKSYFNK